MIKFREFERQCMALYVRKLLSRYGNKVKIAAIESGVSQATFYRMIEQIQEIHETDEFCDFLLSETYHKAKTKKFIFSPKTNQSLDILQSAAQEKCLIEYDKIDRMKLEEGQIYYHRQTNESVTIKSINFSNESLIFEAGSKTIKLSIREFISDFGAMKIKDNYEIGIADSTV